MEKEVMGKNMIILGILYMKVIFWMEKGLMGKNILKVN